MKEFFEKIWVRHTLVVLAILITWQLSIAILHQNAYRKATAILQPRIESSKIIQKGISTLSTKDSSSLQKLQNLSKIVEDRKEEKKRAFLDLYKYHFTSSTMLLILSSLSVVLIFIVAQIGLNNSNPYLKTVFFVFASLTSFYAFSPLVYKHDTNISKNLSSYLSYDNLQGEIYNYALTNPGVTPTNDTLSLDKFHSRIINEMSKINTIDFEFDYKAISIPDFGLSKK